VQFVVTVFRKVCTAYDPAGNPVIEVVLVELLPELAVEELFLAKAGMLASQHSASATVASKAPEQANE
jgi:hypothetical protein